MSQSATVPARERSATEKHAAGATAQALTPSLEDRHLAERVERALRTRGYGALHAVRVSVRTRVVFLEGRVSSYYLKQLAQETALAVSETHRICNDLDVVHPK